ncbi:MAG: hypothetical protein IJ647_02885, partial [Prevotella sp.]|nr:hypothetical protein [Prevotella sp.]
MKTSGGLICEGIIDGNNGVNGYNTIAIALYRRSANTLTNSDRPTGTLTYSFDTGRLTGVSSYFNGWSQNIPATQAGTKLYVIMAVARSQSNTDDIAASDWSTPTEYVADGMNSAVVFIYKRAESVNDKPANGAVYNFKTGVLSGTLNDWSTSIPATDSNHNPCWVRQAMAVSSADTDTIDSSEWSDPATKIVEDGAKGGNTAPIYLYKRSATAVTSVGTLPTLYYSFSKKRLYTNAECTTLFNGSNDWYQDIPSGTNQIYVTTAIAFSAEDSDSIGGSEWVKPVQFTENGEHGVNTATIFIYKRSASQPTDKPTGNIRYTFANGSKALQSGVMNDWSFEIPSGTDACWVRQAAALGTGTYDDVEPSEWSDPATKLVENGTSAWVADGDNEMDSIATDLNGVVTSSKTITDNIKLFHGATEENFTFMSIKRNGTVLTWDANNNNVWPRCSGKTLQIEYDTNAAFAGDKDEYEVTICSAADISIDRVVRIVVNGIRPGATGESATLYNLVPSVTEIVKKKNGTYSPTRFSCACTSLKNNTATDNPSEATMEYSYDETKWYEFTSTSSFLSENVYNNGGRFYIRLLVGGKVMDKETIPVVADGDKGDNAVEYAIVFSEAWAKCDSNNHVTGVLAGTAYRINGTERTLLKGVKIKTGYTDGIGAYIYTNSNSGFFTDGDYFDDDWDDSSTCNSSSSIYALLEIDGEIVCSEYVTIVFDGKSIKGDTGRMYYIAGEFPQNAPYSRTDDLCPVVYYGGEWWYLKTNTTAYSTDTPSDSSDKWGKVEKFGVVLTDAIFVKQFAQFGAAIITQDWLISCHGTIGGVAYGGSVEEPENYNGRAAY